MNNDRFGRSEPSGKMGGAMNDPFDGALEQVEELREFYDAAMERAVTKDIGYLDEMARRLIAAAPMLFVATYSREGQCDVSPRGGQPGFVTVLDDNHLAIPDATGNRRLDTLENVVDRGRAGVIFVIPGRDTTLRVNGRARVTARPDLLARLTPVGKPPRTAIVLEAQEVYAHCPKAFVRSKLWDPATWPDPAGLPTPAAVSVAHQRDPNWSVEQEERRQADALLHRLD
jgi:PPOX class probable FMN-dependent enzyme